ncbi:hypothetical protein [Kitasatospora sp. NPDC093102]|uniref:hypothetical protein n=1 Tax=Kitasatospora sp. NPDC093102 TaxID=3155069 RepID=UPI0034391B69
MSTEPVPHGRPVHPTFPSDRIGHNPAGPVPLVGGYGTVGAPPPAGVAFPEQTPRPGRVLEDLAEPGVTVTVTAADGRRGTEAAA